MFRFLVLVLLFSFSGVSEPWISFDSSLKPTEPELFIGIQNHLTVKSTVKDLSLFVSHGKAIKTGINEYDIMVSDLRPDTLKLLRGNKLLKQVAVPVTTIPGAVARLGGLEDSSGSFQRILLNPFLSVKLPGSNYKHCIDINYFKMSLVSGRDTLVTYSTQSNRFTSEQKNAIKNLNAGDHLYFFDITATCPSCISRKLTPFKFRIL